MFGYRVPAPDQALLISGGKSKGDATPFRVVTGHGAFVLPPFRRATLLSLAMYESRIQDHCVSQQGIELETDAVVAFKVGATPEAIVNAAQRFLSNQDKMPATVGEIFAGHLRSIIGSMTVEDIIRNRQVLATEVLDASKIEMNKMGLVVDSMQIKSIDDLGKGYISALSAPHVAAVQREANIAQAEANRLSVEAQQKAERAQAEYARETAVTKAQYKAEVDKVQAESAQAGPLAEAEAKQKVLDVEAELTKRQATLREQQLQVEVVKPAQAEAERATIDAEARAKQTTIAVEAQAKQTTIAADAEARKLTTLAEAQAKQTKLLADAEAEKIQKIADAAASNDRVSLEQLMVEQLPELVKAAALGLAGANVTLLNGQEGINETLTGIASQGIALYNALRSELVTSPQLKEVKSK